MPGKWATEQADELLLAAGDHAYATSSGEDISASIDRLGARLLYIKERLPVALDDARRAALEEAEAERDAQQKTQVAAINDAKRKATISDAIAESYKIERDALQSQLEAAEKVIKAARELHAMVIKELSIDYRDLSAALAAYSNPEKTA